MQHLDEPLCVRLPGRNVVVILTQPQWFTRPPDTLMRSLLTSVRAPYAELLF